MNGIYEVRHVEFTPATAADERHGLLGYVSFLLGPGLRIDGVTVRRTAAGTLTLSFPARRDRAGRDHFVLRPIDEPTRVHLERQVLDALVAQGLLP